VRPIRRPKRRGPSMNAKPKSLEFAETVALVERELVQALPDIVKALIERAKEGDVRVAMYLAGRVLGKTAGSAVSPANDQRLPYSEEDYQVDVRERKSDRNRRRMIAGIGACIERGVVHTMGLIHRDGRPYLYKSIRKNGRVTSEYRASGAAAVLIDRMEAIERDEADYQRWSGGEENRRLEDLEKELDDLADRARRLAHEALEAAGYHRHHRGEWRRRRVPRG
jgi:hypothetical protein